MRGHLDKFPYIDIWQTLATHPPPWLRKGFEDNCKIMMTRATNTETLKAKEMKGSSSSASDAPQHGGMEPSICLRLTPPNGTNDVRAYFQTAFPKAEPAWDPNEAEG
jgi:hypothetical protein